jgi:DNA-directed RNA polymerase subunit RPC12/RpoP
VRDIDLASGAIWICSRCGKDVESLEEEDEDDNESLCSDCDSVDDKYEAERDRQLEERWGDTRQPETD